MFINYDAAITQATTQSIKRWLIIGNDEGGREVIEKQVVMQLQQDVPDLQVIRVSYSEAKQNWQNLYDQLLVPELFPTPKLVVLREATDNKAVEKLSQIAQEAEVYLIINSGELRKTSQIIQSILTRGSRGISCYKPTNSEKLRYITQRLGAARISYDNAVPKILSEFTPSSWGSVEHELGKIMLYYAAISNESPGKQPAHLDMLAIAELCLDESELILDKLSQAVITEDTASIATQLAKAHRNKVNDILILRSINNYIQKHLLVQHELRQCHDVKLAMKKVLFPMLFGDSYDSFLRIARTLDVDKTYSLLERVLLAEAASKKAEHFDIAHALLFPNT